MSVRLKPFLIIILAALVVCPGIYVAAGYGTIHDGAATFVSDVNQEATIISDQPAPMAYPAKSVVLYHMMWLDSGSPALSSTPPNVNVIRMAFAQGDPPALTGWASDGRDRFVASAKALRARGVRMTVSIGGAGGHVTIANRQAFVDGIMEINKVIPLDGLDWDLEGAAMDQSDVLRISAELKRLRGANFAITMAPNGANIGEYLPIAVALHKAGNLTRIGQQFYDAVVSKEAAINRIDQAVAAGIPISKYEIGMMVGTSANYWTVDEWVANVSYIKAKYPGIGVAISGRPNVPALPIGPGGSVTF